MAKTIKVNLSLNNHELQSFVVEKLSTDPSGLVEARMWYNTTSKQLKYYDGTSIKILAESSQIATTIVTQTNASAAANKIKLSSGADRVLKDYDRGAGIVKVNASGVASAATPGTDYLSPAGAATVTNKTINADNNTISNLETDNFKSGIIKIALSTTGETNLTIPSSKAVVDAILAWATRSISYRSPCDLFFNDAGSVLPTSTTVQIDGITVLNNMRICVGASSGSYDTKIVKATVADTTITYTVQQDGTGSDLPTDGDTVWIKNGTTYKDSLYTFNGQGAWVQTNGTSSIPDATTDLKGKVELATVAEAMARTVEDVAVTPASLVKFPVMNTGDFLIADWVEDASIFTLEILQATHECTTGNRIIVDVYEIGTPNIRVTDAIDITVSDTGDVTLTSLETFDGYWIIHGINLAGDQQ